MRKFLLPLLCLVFVFADRIYHYHGGLKNTYADEVDPKWHVNPPQVVSSEHLQAILSQPFTYFSKGSQSYVYLSADGKYVLKFLKRAKLYPNTWLAYLPFTPPYYKRLRLKLKRHRTFNAIKIATEQFQEETGLIHAHLTSSEPFYHTVALKDRHGKSHQVDLQNTRCLLQKRAQLIYPRITQLMQEGNLAQATCILHSLFDLLGHLGRSGVVDNDPIIRKNFGLIDDRAVQIDIGRLQIDPSRIDATQYQKELRSITHSFRKWVMTEHPTLAPAFEEALRDACN